MLCCNGSPLLTWFGWCGSFTQHVLKESDPPPSTPISSPPSTLFNSRSSSAIISSSLMLCCNGSPLLTWFGWCGSFPPPPLPSTLFNPSSLFAMTTSPLRLFCDISTLLIWSGCGGSSLSCNDLFLRLLSFLFLLYRWYFCSREICFSFLLRFACCCSFLLATDSKSSGNDGAQASLGEFIENKLIVRK